MCAPIPHVESKASERNLIAEIDHLSRGLTLDDPIEHHPAHQQLLHNTPFDTTTRLGYHLAQETEAAHLSSFFSRPLSTSSRRRTRIPGNRADPAEQAHPAPQWFTQTTFEILSEELHETCREPCIRPRSPRQLMGRASDDFFRLLVRDYLPQRLDLSSWPVLYLVLAMCSNHRRCSHQCPAPEDVYLIDCLQQELARGETESVYARIGRRPDENEIEMMEKLGRDELFWFPREGRQYDNWPEGLELEMRRELEAVGAVLHQFSGAIYEWAMEWCFESFIAVMERLGADTRLDVGHFDDYVQHLLGRVWMDHMDAEERRWLRRHLNYVSSV